LRTHRIDALKLAGHTSASGIALRRSKAIAGRNGKA
jgi:hypothetical protein